MRALLKQNYRNRIETKICQLTIFTSALFMSTTAQAVDKDTTVIDLISQQQLQGLDEVISMCKTSSPKTRNELNQSIQQYKLRIKAVADRFSKNPDLASQKIHQNQLFNFLLQQEQHKDLKNKLSQKTSQMTKGELDSYCAVIAANYNFESAARITVRFEEAFYNSGYRK